MLEFAAGLKAALYPGPRQLQIGARTPCAYAVLENRTAPRHVLGKVTRFNCKYVGHHVPRRPRLCENAAEAVTSICDVDQKKTFGKSWPGHPEGKAQAVWPDEILKQRGSRQPLPPAA